MGFGATENGQYGLLPVFEALGNLLNLPNYTFWGHLRSTAQLFSRKKKFIFWCQLRPKMTIKGRKKIEIKGAEIRKKVLISLCLFRYGTFFEYKTIAKKTCAPKTGATLATPNILFGVVCLFVCCCRRLNVHIFVPRLISN